MRYNPTKIEKKWQARWLREKIYEPDLKRAKRPFYNLMMFPYPSAEGLHVGNMYAFTGADIYGRFKRMQGYDVFEPMGLDGFGIHSENYALKTGRHPMEQAKVSEKNFYRQLQVIGNGFAWNERLETYDSDYYKWTQWIFTKLFRKGLAYRKKSPVNWCPSCKTVLADEQVIAGKCERCSNEVVKKDLEQWFLKITVYTERLLKNLDKIDWSERVKIAQRNWIGKKEGINIWYPAEGTDEKIMVFTTRPDTNFGATFVVLAPEHPLALRITTATQKVAVEKYIAAATKKGEADRIAEGRKKTGAFTGRYAINYLTGYKMPIWVGDFVLGGFGTGAVVGVPGHDLRDFEFAREFGLKIIRVVRGKDGDETPITRPEQVQEEEGVMVNSDFLNGMDIHEATRAIMDHVEKNGWGKRVTQYRLRDWLISRQRYWGPPIPMIFCSDCADAGRGERADMSGWYTVAEKDLPIKLPNIKEFRPTGTDQSPLAAVEKFYKVRCPKCRAWARRETDVSDVFLDSSWYYLRYPSVKDKKNPWDAAITKKWLPVDMYIGGAEHSVLHLLYTRFLTMVFHDWKLVHFEEPFTTFRAHGLIIKGGAKMSKSKGNVVNPDEYIRVYGADALRMYLMFIGPFEEGGDFQDMGIRGVTRFLERAWRMATDTKKQPMKSKSKVIDRMLHKTIKKVTEDVETLQYNTAISALMVLLNAFEEHAQDVAEAHIKTFLKLLAPFAPHLTEELWQVHSKSFHSIHCERWPKFNPKLVQEEIATIVIQVNGRVRDQIDVPVGTSDEAVKAMALGREKIKEWMQDKTIQRVIIVPQRLINIVV